MTATKEVVEMGQREFHFPENTAFYASQVYQPLAPSPPQEEAEFSIRLLQAVPPDPTQPPDAPLQFTLHQPIPLSSTIVTPNTTATNPDSPSPSSSSTKRYPFIAISYRAGNPYETTPILINNQPFNAFRSLALGLHRLLASLGREKGNLELEETLYIWADQICINQRDSSEKSQQVARMRDIYEASAWTYAWLGPGENIDRGLHGINRLAFVQETISDAMESVGKSYEDIDNVANGEIYSWVAAGLERLEGLEVDWRGVKALLDNEYWTRGWIYQEITVSPDVTYNTASYENDREGLGRAFKLLSLIRASLRWDFEFHAGSEDEKLVPKWTRVNAPDIDKMVVWANQLKWLHGYDLDPFRFVLEASTEWKGSKGFILHELMLASRRSVVSDPLDKVYAFLGLASSRYDITPNYHPSQTVEDVFVEATAQWIKVHEALDILSFAEERTDDLGSALPSWACDWTYKHPTASLWYRWRSDPRRPRASGRIGFVPRFLPHEGKDACVFPIVCIKVDTIIDVETSAGRPVLQHDSWEQALASWARIAGLEVDRGYSEINNASYPYVEGSSLAVAFWSTVQRGIKTPKMMRKFWRRLEIKLGGEVDGESEDSEEEIEAALMDDYIRYRSFGNGGEEDEEWEDVEDGEDGEEEESIGESQSSEASEIDQVEDEKGDASLDTGLQAEVNADTNEHLSKGDVAEDNATSSNREETEAEGEDGDDDESEDEDEGNNEDDKEDEGGDGDENDDEDEGDERKLPTYADNGSGFSQHHLAMSTLFDRNYLTKAGWRFLRSPKGYFCLAKRDVQDGDIIAVVIGSDMPLILRPYLDGYKLVGEVYVYGIMHGELVKDFKEPGEEGSTAESVLLY